MPTPTQTFSSLNDTPGIGPSASSASGISAQQGQSGGVGATGSGGRPGTGNREADGGWCVSWCKDRYWGEIIAAAAGIGGLVKVPPYT
jgi:nucleoporin SEH1